MDRVGKSLAPARVALALAACLLAATAIVALLLANGDDTEPADSAQETPIPVEPDGGIGDGAGPPGGGGSRQEQGGGPRPADGKATSLRRAERVYRDYVQAINAEDGEEICGRLIRPGFERTLRPPVSRGGCAASISASIGYADPRGFPVWEETTLSGIESAALGAGRRVTINASIVTAFRDRKQPSVESDIAYLEPSRGGYRLAKASGALWRAVGKADVPFDVVEEPQGF